MKTLEWVLPDTVLALHERLIAEFGGASGIRDAGMWASALARPVNQHGYGKPTVWELGAAYTFGLVRDHPFVDGNKRIGYAVGVVFLELNGLAVTATEADAVIQTLALAAGGLDEAGYAAWLRKNSRRRRR